MKIRIYKFMFKVEGKEVSRTNMILGPLKRKSWKYVQFKQFGSNFKTLVGIQAS